MSTLSDREISKESVDFKLLTLKFFLYEVNICPTKNILNLILTNVLEKTVNLSCISAKTVDLSSDNNLLFFSISYFMP